MVKYFYLLFITLSIFSCKSHQKFDKSLWEKRDDIFYPNRKFMIDDLVKSYKLKGKKYRDIVELLGPPESILDSTLQIFYEIDVDYGTDIDPVYSKSLVIIFDKDTVVKSFRVEIWKK